MRVSVGAVTITLILVAPATSGEAQHTRRPDALNPGDTFSDCKDHCPLMVVMPAGQFVMGSSRYPREHPRHAVAFRRLFAVGRFAVTFDEWAACASGGGCTGNPSPADEGWGRGRHPVINVSWLDARDYAAWLSRKTGKEYRLPTEAEWEYVARAGSTTTYAWGDAISCGRASYDGGSGSSCSSKTGWWGLRGTQPVGRYAPNNWGLFDVNGNVWQWCEDGWHPDYHGAPADGTAWPGGDQTMGILRGGAWNYDASGLRIADRNWYPKGGADLVHRFRIATPLDDNIAMLGE